MRRLLLAAALALAALFQVSATAMAASIPVEAASQPKTLWKLVMETYYGPYDKRLKCWTARIGDKSVCMRPHRLDEVTLRGVRHLFLVIGGTRLDESGQPQESHADSGVLGLIVLRQEGGELALAAKNDLDTDFGSFGHVPPDEAFAIREIGPDQTYGWVGTGNWMGQGHMLKWDTIFALVGDKIVSIGTIPSHYDNSGNCENGKVMGSDKPCTDYSAELLFDPADGSGRFSPLIVKVAGTREGMTLQQTFTTSFDPGTLSYRKIEGLPEEFANGI